MFRHIALALIAAAGISTGAAVANTHVDATCRAWDNGMDTGVRVPCRVQFDRYGATSISHNGTTYVRGLHGIHNGYQNKECLRSGVNNFAVCPIGNFGF